MTSRPRCFALLYSAVYCIWLMITPSSACTGNRAPTEMVSPQSWTLVSTDCGTVSYTLLVTDPESDALTGSFVTLVDGFSFQNTGPSPRLHCDATIISDAGISSYTLNINVDDTCTNRLNFQMTVTFTDITASTNHNDPTLSPLTVDVVRDHFETVEAPVTTLTGTDVDGDDVTSVTISANPVKRPAGVDQEYVNPQQPNYLFSFAYETTAPIGIVSTGTTSAFSLQLEGSLASVASPVTLTLDVVDSGTPPRTATVTLTVTIKERPVFTSPVDGGTLYFCEDFIGGDDIANLTYTDTDSPTGVTFSVANYDATNVPFEAVGSVLKVASGITAGTFNVDPPVASPVQYTVQLTVSDGTYDSTITVTLEVDDVNDNAPVISPSPIPEQTILESLAAGSTILELTTSDGDRDSPNNVVTLSLSGTNSGHFVFDGNVLKLATPSPLDYDVIQEYNLVVTATDGADPSEAITATENIRIVVQAEPVIVNPAVGESPTEVPEDTAAGHVIYTFTSTDKDTDVATLVYTMGTQTPASPTPFGIVGNVLQTTAGLTADALDAEAVGAVTAYSIDVSVTDGTYTDTATLQLTITDVNDNDPVFDAASYAAAINENTAAGTSVLNVVATDDDVTAANNVITFSMTGTNSAHFAIDGSTGEITVADPSMLDYATVSSYTLDIVATDSGTPARSATVTATITLESSPVFVKPEVGEGPTEVPEDTAAGLAVYIFSASDKDTDAASLTYRIGAQDPVSPTPFEIVGNELKTKANLTADLLDVETTGTVTSYIIDVTVTDGTYSDSATLHLTIIDVNDNNPAFDEGSYSIAINENTVAGTNILNVSATDADVTTENNIITYSMTGTNSAHFAIDGSTGEITVADPSMLDYATVSSYTLDIVATDSGTPARSATVTATITLESSPVFVKPEVGEGPTEVPEDTAAGLAVYIFSASDKDTDAASLTYRIGAQDPVSPTPFEIVGNELKTKANLTADLLDVETTGTVTSYIIDVTVTDGTYSDSATLHLTIIDVNDNNPAFDEGSYSIAINENTVAGTNILNVSATDADVTTENNIITYSMTGTNAVHFAIDGATGEITVADPSMLNYTTLSSYTLNIVATDRGTPALSATVPATITIEASPILVRPAVGEDPTVIEENKAASNLVYTFVSTDKDTDLSGLAYTIVAQDPETPVPFDVVGSTLVTKAGLGADVLDQDGTDPVGTYTLTIRVSDGKYTDDGAVVINILDSNDESPSFAMPTQTFNIGEDASGIIGSVVASDGDLTSPYNVVTYTITGGNDEGLFAMDSVGGAISLTDQVKLLRYQLTVTATDGGTPANSETANVVVNVKPDVIDECASNPCKNGATCRPNINYFWCDCAEGWTGITCEINIDDCDPDPCQNNGTCVDGVASYTCDCQPGWGGETCTQACTGHTYGANCAQTCSCNDSHVATTTAAQAQKCNIVSGACVCTVSWTGTSCDDDAIECGQGTAVCSVTNTVCQDTFGSYQCICATGYTPGTSGDCVTDDSDDNPLILPSAVVDAAKARGSNVAIVAVILMISNCPNLYDPDEYNAIKSSLESQHSQQNLGISVRVYNIRIVADTFIYGTPLANRVDPDETAPTGAVSSGSTLLSNTSNHVTMSCGSLKYELFVETANTTAATVNLSQKLKDLRDNGTLTVAGQSASVQDMMVESNAVPANNRLCSIYESLSPCGADYTCQVEDGTPRCREVKDDNTDVILGVGIGVGVGLFLVGVLIACIVMWQRKSRQEKYMRPRKSGVYADRIKRQQYDDDRYDRRHDRSHDRSADIYNSGFDDRFDDRYADRPSSIPYAKPAPRMHDQMYDNKDVIMVPYKHTDDFY